MTGREFGKKLGHGDQWVSNLLTGRFGLSLDELDAAARAVGVPPSELVRDYDEEARVLTPSESRILRALRQLPMPIRDHFRVLAEYLVGVAPEEIGLITKYRKLTEEEQRRVEHLLDVLLLSQGAERRRAASDNRAVPESPEDEASPAAPQRTRKA